MEHRIEEAPSGRATCKTCGKSIAKGELRLGEQYESQFGSDGLAVRWHHLNCGAEKIKDVLRAAIDRYRGEIPNLAALESAMASTTPNDKGAKGTKSSGVLPTADLAPTARAKCIECAAAIDKGSVRIAVEREVDTGSFVTKGAGYLHPLCAKAWAENEWPAGFVDLVSQVKANATIALPDPFGDAAQGDTTAATQSATPAKAKKSTKASESDGPPAFGALSSKQLTSLAQKMRKLDDEYKADSLIEKAGVDYAERAPLRWYLARHGLVPPTHITMLGRLSEGAFEAGTEEVFAVLPHLHTPPETLRELAPGWPHDADAIVLRAFQLNRERLEDLLPSVSTPVRVGIQMVRGRQGAELSASDKQAVLNALAYAEATEYGIIRTTSAEGERLSLRELASDGKWIEPYRAGSDLAGHFGTEEQWAIALADACRAGKFGGYGIGRLSAGLARLPLSEFVRLLSGKHQSSDARYDRMFAALLAARQDSPEALIEAARTLEDGHASQYLREDLRMHALRMIAEQGLPVPEGLELEMTWDPLSYVWSPWRDYDIKYSAYRRGLEALGRDRTIALAKKRIDDGRSSYLGLPFLSMYWDEALLQKVLDDLKDYGDPTLFARLGPKVLPYLVAAMNPEGTVPRSPKSIAILRRAIEGVLGLEAREGRSCEPQYDVYLSCEPSESYWHPDLREPWRLAISGLPEARKQAVLDRLFEETKQPERPFMGVSTVKSPAYREKAIRLLVQRHKNVADQHTLQVGLKALPAGSLALFQPALLEEKPEQKFFQELKNVFGFGEVDALMAAAGVKEEKPFDRLLRLARERGAGGGSTSRIYLLERADPSSSEGAIPSPRSGSFSCSRGTGPGIDRKALKLGEREHIITLDLEDVPELKANRPNVRALALYAEGPEHGDDWEDALLIEVPMGTMPAEDGEPISVVPLDVPDAVFDPDGDDSGLKEIRTLIFNRPGYALGEPMFIQEDAGGGDGFVMQLAEHVGDLNLGDAGSLYVFEDTVFMQCH